MKGRIAGLLVMVAVVGLLLWNNRAVGLPDYFDTSLTYGAALDRGAASGRPVFVYASADWCAPCREFRRSALRDRRVRDWLTKNTIPVYLDVTSESSPGVAAAGELGVTSIPAIFLIRGGEPVGKHEGVLAADELLNWLETFAKATPAG